MTLSTSWTVPTLLDAFGRGDGPDFAARWHPIADEVQRVLAAWAAGDLSEALPRVTCDCQGRDSVAHLVDVRALPIELRTRPASHPAGPGVYEAMCGGCRWRLFHIGASGQPGGTPMPPADFTAALGAPEAVAERLAAKATDAVSVERREQLRTVAPVEAR